MECTNWLNISGLAVSLADLKLFSKARTSLAWSLEAWSFWSGWLKIRLDARVSVNRWLVAEGVGLPTSFTWRRTLAMAPEEAELKGWKTCVSVQSEDSNRPSPNTVTWQECSLLKREKQELNIAANSEFRWIFGSYARKLHISIFGPHAHCTHDDHEKRCENEKSCFFSKKCAQKQAFLPKNVRNCDRISHTQKETHASTFQNPFRSHVWWHRHMSSRVCGFFRSS